MDNNWRVFLTLTVVLFYYNVPLFTTLFWSIRRPLTREVLSTILSAKSAVLLHIVVSCAFILLGTVCLNGCFGVGVMVGVWKR